MSNKEEQQKKVEILRAKGRQFQEGKITEEELKGYCSGSGCFVQKEGGFTLRLCTVPGDISRDYLRLIIKYAERQGAEAVYLTVKQSLQLEGLTIGNACDLLEEAAEQGLLAGRNQARSVSLSPMAGADREETFDVTPFALLADSYLAERAEEQEQPRKLKIAFSSSRRDTGGAMAADLGFVAGEADGTPCFRMYLAGGQGSRPQVGLQYPEMIEPAKMLYYLEAMLRLCQKEGSRPRVIAEKMGYEGFIACFDHCLSQVMEEEDLKKIEPEGTVYIPWEPKLEMEDVVIPQKQDKKYTVVLHPQNGIMLIKDLKELTDFLDFHEHARLRLSADQDFYVGNITRKAAEMLIDGTCEYNCVDRAGKTVCCTGGASCRERVCDIRGLSREIAEVLRGAGLEDVLPKIHISGCSHGCARHLTADLGVVRRLLEKEDGKAVCYEVYVGGKTGPDASIAKKAGTLSQREVPGLFLEMARDLEGPEI